MNLSNYNSWRWSSSSAIMEHVTIFASLALSLCLSQENGVFKGSSGDPVGWWWFSGLVVIRRDGGDRCALVVRWVAVVVCSKCSPCLSNLKIWLQTGKFDQEAGRGLVLNKLNIRIVIGWAHEIRVGRLDLPHRKLMMIRSNRGIFIMVHVSKSTVSRQIQTRHLIIPRYPQQLQLVQTVKKWAHRGRDPTCHHHHLNHLRRQ
ncbi:hypothetical protein G4B88_017262 [Cannabis sativa]|uniref:Uncharacterized protein n=1 Tax=Cannabis sativa TaxID=3483 RepID=A0A7J6HSD5_CANSA|nr:hypothetical protein G4B88_017262 [Cannabis sativa]